MRYKYLLEYMDNQHYVHSVWFPNTNDLCYFLSLLAHRKYKIVYFEKRCVRKSD